jgi:O-Antigen ligase
MKFALPLEKLRAYKLILAFAAVVVGLMFTPGAKLLILLYPCGCFYVAFSTFRKDSAQFLEFATWIFFLTPFVRRVVDYETNAREMAIISTPFVILVIPLLFVVMRWRKIATRQSAPFLYAIAAILYGVFIACAHAQFSSAATGVMTWLTPIAFGLYLLSEREHVSALYNGFERAMLGGTFVAGAYGLIQYFIVPSWDAAWMRSVDMVTIGQPEPTEVRVFSILNSPQILAAFLMVGILMAYRMRSRWKYPILLAGVASLALSFARSAWIGLLAGLLFLGFFASPKERIRTITATIGCALLVFAAFNVPALADALSTRFSTFTDLRHDESALDRKETYAQVIEMLQHSPTGIGLGVDNGMADAENDSSVVAVLLSLGIPGALVFAVALCICACTLFSPRAVRDRSQLLGLQCCFVGLAVESPLNNVINAQIAFLLWSLIGLSYGIRATQQNRDFERNQSRVRPLIVN